MPPTVRPRLGRLSPAQWRILRALYDGTDHLIGREGKHYLLSPQGHRVSVSHAAVRSLFERGLIEPTRRFRWTLTPVGIAVVHSDRAVTRR